MNTSDIQRLQSGWENVVAVRDASPPGCACRATTGPLIDAWIGRITVNLRPEEIARAWSDLERAQAAQTSAAMLPAESGDYILDVRSKREFQERPRSNARNIDVEELVYRLHEIPKDRRIVIFCQSGKRAERATFLLRNRGYHACNGHEDSCPIPENDPPMGSTGESSGILSSLFTSAQGAAADAASNAGSAGAKGATDQARAAIPGLADAIRGEIPKTISTVSDAAKQEIPDVISAGSKAAESTAEAAGEAAGRGAARGARDEAGVNTRTVLLGGVALIAMVGIGFAVFGFGNDVKK